LNYIELSKILDMPSDQKWYRISNEKEIFSPSLLIYPERVESNIRRMVEISGDVANLRPHVKTHKMSEIVKLQMKYGISKFKCATIAEAEMVAECGASDILLAIQPVGPNIERFLNLQDSFGQISFSCIADSAAIVHQISASAAARGKKAGIWLDINAGMNRTGILPGAEAIDLYKLIHILPGSEACGLHVYDGHIHEKDFPERQAVCRMAFSPVLRMIEELGSEGFGQIRVVAGGSPTFPVHASSAGTETSPGTVLLWDYNYASSFPDLDFSFAAVLFTRVISKPGDDLICIDLGHKAVGSEMPQPRIHILDFGDYTITGHNEEHMVIKTPHAGALKIGDVLYAVPCHICPTVDRYDSVYVVRDSVVSGRWKVEARSRQINF
jgi:D-serine deaminase-like pyridoxal phosphate-dependent protein